MFLLHFKSNKVSVQNWRFQLSALKINIWYIGPAITCLCLFPWLSVLTTLIHRGNTGIFNACRLTCFSSESSVVPGHIGCIHVYKVNVNPEIDTKRNRLMRLNINVEQVLWGTGRLKSLGLSHHIILDLSHGCGCWVCVCYLSGEMLRCLLSSPHRSLEYCLLWAPLILPILWREQTAQGSPFPPNIIIWSEMICTAIFWYVQDRDTRSGLLKHGHESKFCFTGTRTWRFINFHQYYPTKWLNLTINSQQCNCLDSSGLKNVKPKLKLIGLNSVTETFQFQK